MVRRDKHLMIATHVARIRLPRWKCQIDPRLIWREIGSAQGRRLRERPLVCKATCQSQADCGRELFVTVLVVLSHLVVAIADAWLDQRVK
jgi:hypothetical protein